MRFGYYPGCSLESSAVEFDLSLRKVAPLLGIELVELPDWNCCGASAAHSINHLLSLALPARNLAIAEGENLLELMPPCSACYSNLAKANYELLGSPGVLRQINQLIEMNYQGRVRVLSILELLNSIGIEKIVSVVKNNLDGKKVACYYGCLMLRPPKVTGRLDFEQPRGMDEVVRALGGEPVSWGFKTECCGAGFSMSKTEVVLKLCHDILNNARANGAELIALACPMCMSNLDMRQNAILKRYGVKESLPILYITELMGLALGFPPEELGLNRHYIPVTTI
ncbi:MAG: CoB--CoM heterodisulfide reductase iron-sulfur subunit B family protein [Deltaproteobacteria bacterium]|nr:MAG: CoB--CoM heterodisulfide reductase iron-sulfur subunit B family protein [Deltaproteobacteria bacterium]